MSTSRRWATLAAFPVTLGLFLAGPAVGTAAAAPQPDQSTAQARHHCLLCVGHGHVHGGVHLGLGLHLGLWLHL